jgi:hypothetical protein
MNTRFATSQLYSRRQTVGTVAQQKQFKRVDDKRAAWARRVFEPGSFGGDGRFCEHQPSISNGWRVTNPEGQRLAVPGFARKTYTFLSCHSCLTGVSGGSNKHNEEGGWMLLFVRRLVTTHTQFPSEILAALSEHRTKCVAA